MDNFMLAARIAELLNENGHTAYAKLVDYNTQVASVFVIDDDERRCHSILVDFAIAPRVGRNG